ncbi:MAG: hypothetical protein AAGC64_13860 [Bacteroidota bacterium]
MHLVWSILSIADSEHSPIKEVNGSFETSSCLRKVLSLQAALFRCTKSGTNPMIGSFVRIFNLPFFLPMEGVATTSFENIYKKGDGRRIKAEDALFI